MTSSEEVLLDARYKNGKLVIKQEEIEGNMFIPVDERTMEAVKRIINSIHPSI